jgi:hypothetical protein
MGINNELLEVLAALESPTIVEVGVAQAEGALRILALDNLKCYIGVDPWLRYEASPLDELQDGYLDRKMGLWATQGEWEDVYERAKARVAPFGDKARLIRAYSHEAVDQIDEPVDVAYIDGNHQYEYVLKDLAIWLDKLAPGGLLCGDDYHFSGGAVIDGKYGGLVASEVGRAVEDFCKQHGLEHEVLGDSFIIRKPL